MENSIYQIMDQIEIAFQDHLITRTLDFNFIFVCIKLLVQKQKNETLSLDISAFKL